MLHSSRIFIPKVLIAVLVSMVFVSSYAFAQNVSSEDQEAAAVSEAKGKSDKKISYKQIPSLFFTARQNEAIVDAMNRRGVARPVSAEELKALEAGEKVEPDIGIRELSLAGIVYRGEKDWVIWLNDTRVTPDAVPKEVMDLEVFKEYIQVKWFDQHTNSIYPVRLRPHQRFNLDMRIYLTGESGN